MGRPPSDVHVPGRATRAGTARFAERALTGRARAGSDEGVGPAAHPDHFRRPDDLTLSSLALGTRQGEPGGVDDLLLRSSVPECLAGGVNVFNTALSDRMQTSERALGNALRRALREGSVRRDEIVLVSKGGALTGEPDRVRGYDSLQRDLWETYVAPGLVRREDVRGGHAMTPGFLDDQIERSRENLGFECIDFYLLQEPEIHLKALGPDGFRDALARAFEVLEAAARQGRIGAYGLCTWDGFLRPDSDRHHLSLLEVFEVALEVGSGDHHMRAVQLPYGLAMGEGAVLTSQLGPDGHSRAVLDQLRDTGTIVFASAPLYAGRLVGRVPDFVRAAFPETRSDAQCALQFVRSTANVTCAVVGMRDPSHVEENLALASVAPAEPERPARLFARASQVQAPA